MINAEISAYDLADGKSRIERCKQGSSGKYAWAIRRNGECLNKNGEWEYELPHSRHDDEFIARCRFDSAESAYELWVKKEQWKLQASQV